MLDMDLKSALFTIAFSSVQEAAVDICNIAD